jgi:hypothetical protein
VKVEPQKRQAASASWRGAPQAEQRTTAESCGVTAGTGTVAPQMHSTLSPGCRSPASSWRRQRPQSTSWRMAWRRSLVLALAAGYRCGTGSWAWSRSEMACSRASPAARLKRSVENSASKAATTCGQNWLPAAL